MRIIFAMIITMMTSLSPLPSSSLSLLSNIHLKAHVAYRKCIEKNKNKKVNKKYKYASLAKTSNISIIYIFGVLPSSIYMIMHRRTSRSLVASEAFIPSRRARLRLLRRHQTSGDNNGRRSDLLPESF